MRTLMLVLTVALGFYLAHLVQAVNAGAPLSRTTVERATQASTTTVRNLLNSVERELPDW